MVHAITIGFGLLWALLLLRFLKKPLRQAWRDSIDQAWHHRFVWTVFGLALAANLVLAPGCVYRPAYGQSTQVFAAAQGLFALRLLFALIRKETGPGWIAWSLVIWTSPFWITTIINLRFDIPWDIGT